MNELQIKQHELNQFILDKKGIKIMDPYTGYLSVTEYLKNMLLACSDEIYECEMEPLDVMEYIDVLHFALSIANIYGFVLPNKYDTIDVRTCMKIEEIPTALRHRLNNIIRLDASFKHWSNKVTSPSDLILMEFDLHQMAILINLACEKLGMDMETMYNDKYQINIDRQKKNY